MADPFAGPLTQVREPEIEYVRRLADEVPDGDPRTGREPCVSLRSPRAAWQGSWSTNPSWSDLELPQGAAPRASGPTPDRVPGRGGSA